MAASLGDVTPMLKAKKDRVVIEIKVKKNLLCFWSNDDFMFPLFGTSKLVAVGWFLP